MARIGWGPVPIVLAEIGIALEFPDPLRLLLFGQVHVGLPSLARPVLDLHMDLFGAIDLDAGTLAIDAALVDSAIAGFRLEGEAALRAKWKGFDPEFAMAVGGFHPRAVPPANFPSLGRVSLDLSPTRRVRIGLESYFALTANSVQCGARVDLAASVGRISAEAFLGFDTLFQFEPFRFQVDVAAGAVVRAFGRTVLSATLDFRLSGPRPWHAVGTIRYRVVIRRTEHLDITFGDEPDRRPVVIENPRERLLEELGRASAWSGQHQPFGGTAVALRDPSGESDGELLLHPQGRPAVTQTVMPLDRAIEKYGERPIGDPHGFFIAAVRVNGRQVQFDVTRERFALSQFFELTEHQRLSLPAYQAFSAGMRTRAEGKSAGDRVSVQPQYEEVVLDRLRGERRRTPERTSLPAGVLARQHERSALARAVRGNASGSVFPNRGRRIRLRAAE